MLNRNRIVKIQTWFLEMIERSNTRTRFLEIIKGQDQHQMSLFQ